MSPELKQKLQIVLAVAIAVSALRLAYILYERSESRHKESQKQAPPLNADAYVVPKKLYPYDLKSARQLTQQPVWVKEGFRYTYYPYDPVNHRSDFSHEAGQLLPIEKLSIKDVVTDISPGSPDQRQVMAVFEKAGHAYSFPIGSLKAGDYRIYSDEMLFLQDPHELYHHWPADIWQAIDRHEVIAGMNELQADFATGMGIPEGSGLGEERILHYPNGGKPLTVVYRNGKAAEIKPGPG